MATALAQDALLPRPPGGTLPGAVLALAVHAGLVAALTLGVDWRAHEPELVSAELWATVPQSAAPAPLPEPAPAPPPPPPAPEPVKAEPPPPPPEIATERDKPKPEKKPEKKPEPKPEPKPERKPEPKPERKPEAKPEPREDPRVAEEARLAQLREENLRRMMAQANSAATGSTGTASVDAAPSANYLGLVRKRLRDAIVFTGVVESNAAAEVEVTAAASGTILTRRLVKSSGYKDWDDAVLRAIDRVGQLPVDSNGRAPQRLLLSFRPNER